MTRGPDAAALNNLADAVVGQLPRILADVCALLEARDADYAAFLAAEYDEVLGAAGHFRATPLRTRRGARGRRRARGRAPCPFMRWRGADRRASGTPWPARRRRAPPRWRAGDGGWGGGAAGPGQRPRPPAPWRPPRSSRRRRSPAARPPGQRSSRRP